MRVNNVWFNWLVREREKRMVDPYYMFEVAISIAFIVMVILAILFGRSGN